MGISINELSLEVTRKCNNNCWFCVRGEQQNKNLDLNKFKLWLQRNEITEINNINFTGGEPSLVPHIISQVITVLDSLDIILYSFTVITNGIYVSDKFISVCNKLYQFCIVKQECRVFISNNDELDNKEGLNKLLSTLSFAKPRPKMVFGRNIIIGVDWEGDIIPKLIKEYGSFEEAIKYQPIYFTVDGKIGIGCDFSYEHIDDNYIYNHNQKIFVN